MVLFVGLTDDEDPLCQLGIDGLQLLLLGAMTVQHNQSPTQRGTLYLRHEPLAHFFRVLLRENDDRVVVVFVTLTDESIHQHLVCAEKQHMVMKTIAQQTATESRSAVLHDVTQQGDKQTGNQHDTHQVHNNLEHEVVVIFLKEVTGRQNQSENLINFKRETQNGAEAPEKSNQSRHDDGHIEDLSSLTLTEQTVYAIRKTIHRWYEFMGSNLCIYEVSGCTGKNDQ